MLSPLTSLQTWGPLRSTWGSSQAVAGCEPPSAASQALSTIANLGTAWQLQGDLEQAAACLREAVKLAPGKYQGAEELQLRLVEGRRKSKNPDALDDLFGIHFTDSKGQYVPGRLAPGSLKKLPADALAQVQLLALWLPADVRLLWLLGEMANVQGDLKTAAAIFDGCLTEFNSRSPELRQHRQLTRAAVDAQAN